MKKAARLFPALVAMVLLLSGCSASELLHRGGEMFDNMTSLSPSASTPAPTQTPAPSPTPLPGAAGQAQAFLEALQREDRAVVRSYAGDGVPGFGSTFAPESSLLQTLYGNIYQNLSWRFGAVSEGANKASVSVELTTLDMRLVMEELRAQLSAFMAGEEHAAMTPEERQREYDGLLYRILANDPATVTKKATLSLHREGERWFVDVGSELKAALTGSLTMVLPDFDLPPESSQWQMNESERAAEAYLTAGELGAVVVKRILPNAPEGYTLEVEVSNYAHNELVYSLRSCTVDGYVLDPNWYVSVPGSSKLTSYIVWDRQRLADCAIESIGRIEGIVDVFEKPAWPVYPLTSRYCSLTPGTATERTRPTAQTERVLLENEEVYVSVLQTRSQGCWGYEMQVYLENNSAEELWFSLGETRLNGIELDPGWSQTLPAGTRALETIRWSAGDMMMLGLSAVESVNLRLFVSSLQGLDEQEGSYKAGGEYSLTENT